MLAAPGLRDLQADDRGRSDASGSLRHRKRDIGWDAPGCRMNTPALAQLAVTNGIDGLIISNTIAREAWRTAHAAGKAFKQSLYAWEHIRSVVVESSKLTLVGVGGVTSAQQA